AAGRADQLVAVHERRLAVVPAGHHAPAQLLALVALAPFDIALLDAEAGQLALAAEGVDAVAVHRRRGAPAVVLSLGDARRPQLLAGGLVEGENGAVGLAVADGEDGAAGDGNAREAAADALGGPEQARAALGPLLEQAGLGGDAVVVRAAPA